MKGLALASGYVALRHYYKKPSGIIVKQEDLGHLERCVQVVGINDEKFGDIEGRCVVVGSSYMTHGEVVEVDGKLCMILPSGSIMAVYSEEETKKMLKKYTATAEEVSSSINFNRSPIVAPAQA